MAEQRSTRRSDGSEAARAALAERAEHAAGESRAKSDSQLRLVTPDGQVLFPDDEPPSDDSPTIISKSHPKPTDNITADPNSLRGRRLAHFELIEPIGVGGMAAVLRARDTQLDRLVALKILPPEMARDPENVKRFHQEARAAAKLDHANIARVFFCGEDQGLHFIAFEFVEGDNLRVLLERRGVLPVHEAVYYMLQIASGLEHAEARGVVHRDVKPSNIIISPNGSAKLVDMGLARSLERHQDHGLTQSGVTLGTVDYISPEQALEPREADSRSDIYSLGCTFYHMLTGQPPVPEGTAAKKLHHHQNVAPVDPRQLNPEVPDEVALILSKMMAKNPRDRYQRPTHLVQHLLQIAEKVGASSEMGEPRFVDVQLPTAPQRRPMLVISMAALALALLLFLLSLAPPSGKRGQEPPKKPADPPAALVKKPLDPAPKVPGAAPQVPIHAVARNEDELQAQIDRAVGNETSQITLEGDLRLTGKLKVKGSPRTRPVIHFVGSEVRPARLWLDLAAVPTTPLAGLHVEGANVAFKNVRFELVAAENVGRIETTVSTVDVAGNCVVDFEQCVFAQTGLPLDTPFIRRRQQGISPVASVRIETPALPGTEAAKVVFRESYFVTGQAGVAVVGPGAPKITARDCAFHTLGALFHLKGGGEPTLTLEHCSALLRNGPAFRIDDETPCRLRVEYCLFSSPAFASRTGDEADFIHQTDSKDPNLIIYQGQANVYHNLNALHVARFNLIAVDDLKVFRKSIAGNQGFDKESLVLPKDPAPFINDGQRQEPVGQAFALNTSVRELQTPRDRHPEHPMIGLRRCLGRDLPPLPPLVLETPVATAEYKPAANEKVVDPDHKSNIPGYYDSLAEALAVVAPGDVILLKPGTAGAAQVDFALKPSDREADLTIRGFPGTFPTLTLGDTRISDAYLFRLLEGRLTLENLHLVIEPQREGYTSQALVAIVGNGQCHLRNCVVTLKSRDRSTPKSVPLSVVTLMAAEDAKMMMSDTRLTPPQVMVQDCFVRGDGDFLSVRGSRPLNVQVNQSLFLLNGSLLHQHQGATKEITSVEAAQTFRLSRSAFLFAEPLFWLRGGKAPSRFQHPVRVEQSDHCLFASIAERPLVALDIPEVTDKNLSSVFDWKGRDNAYVHFDTAYLLEHTPPDDGLRLFHFDETSWKERFEREGEPHFEPMGLVRLSSRSLAQMSPEEVKPRPENQTELQPYFDPLPRFPIFRREELP